MRGDSTRGNKWKMWIINFSRQTLFSRKMNLKMYAARASDRMATKRFDRKIMFQCFSPNHAGTTCADCLFIRLFIHWSVSSRKRYIDNKS